MSLNSIRLDGKAIIITGSSSGIGAATAIMCAERGGLLTIHGRRKEKLEEVALQIQKVSDNRPIVVIGDIALPSIRAKIVQETLDTYGRIDVLVNNAGHGQSSGWNSNLSDLQTMLDVHVIAPLDLSQRVMPELIKNKGNIVMTSSISGMTGHPTVLHYSIAKGAMQQMMKSLSAEVAKPGVRVNSVCPGIILTDILRTEEMKELGKKVFL